MGRAAAAKPQIWHCDPLIICGDGDAIVFADQADIEYTPVNVDGVEGIGRVLDVDDGGPDLIIRVRSSVNRLDKLSRGGRHGYTLFGQDEQGAGVIWYVGGAADTFSTRLAKDKIAGARDVGMLAIRKDDTGEIVFSGQAVVTFAPPQSVENLASLQLVSPTLEPAPVIEVEDMKKVWPSFVHPSFGEIRWGRDRQGNRVSWHFGSAAARLLDK